MSKHAVIPSEPAALQGWITDFKNTHGMAPFAGGETPGGVATAPPPPAPAPEQPAAQPAQQPAAPAGGQPAAPADPNAAPAQGAQAPGAEMPEFAQDLFNRMDQLLPPAQVDPLAVELGLVPAPAQPLPGQQGYDPSQQFGQPAGPGQPGALPQQPQALPGQPQAGVPGQQPDPNGQGAVDPQTELVERYIEQRAAEAAEKLIGEKVTPLFQQQEAARRRAESQSLLDDYGELKDPAKSQALVAQARAWAGETLGDPRYAAEPGYLETVHLAMKGLELGKLVQEGKITLPEGVSAPLAAPAAPGAPAGSGEVPIEGPGGAQPGSPTPESTQRAQAIVEAGPAAGLNNLWV